jgi:hypothetical protein
MMRVLQCGVLIVLFAFAGMLHAATIGVATSQDTVFMNTGTWTLGYSFQVNAPISVVSLGVYDHNSDGLNVRHAVGLWDSSANLLASVTVPAGTAGLLNGGYRFSAITGVPLSVGQVYYVGSVNGFDNDEWLQDPSSLVAAPEITYLSRGYAVSSGGLVFPELAGSGSTGYFGGNFEFESGAIPEPGTFALVGVAAIALAALRRRSK